MRARLLMLASLARAFRAPAARNVRSSLRAVATEEKPPFYCTTPIYYVNAAPHIGHAYTSVACDAAVRFAKLDGRRAMLSFDVDFDRFVRTTEPAHARAVEKLWKALEANGMIYLGSYEGWYCVRDECYYTESELVDGKAPTGADVEWKAKEPSYFFKLSAFREKLIDLYEGDEDALGPKSRRNEVLSFLKGEELRDLSISRTTFKWGLSVPGDDDHVIYVWVDALANYLTAPGYGDDDDEWRDMWAGATHVVGKDILRFHAVYWPALLLAADLPPPKKIFAHGWWTKDGAKISKSLGNAVTPPPSADGLEPHLDPLEPRGAEDDAPRAAAASAAGSGAAAASAALRAPRAAISRLRFVSRNRAS
ncbi:hypothetical protein JL720_13813 [Aureococcus anophagefferens]|nr:hypothetical protein JL720_13813 [Aureococcus anophagefferens]